MQGKGKISLIKTKRQKDLSEDTYQQISSLTDPFC